MKATKHKTKFITTEEYAKSGLKGEVVSQQSIRKAIKDGKMHLLPNVIALHKSGKYHLLEVPVE
jgi:hypothetical protein